MIDTYQEKLKQQMIDPDEISLPLNEGNRLAADLISQMVAFKHNGNGLLTVRIAQLRMKSQMSLWLLSSILIIVAFASSYLLIAIYRSLVINVNQVKKAAERLGAGDFTETLASKDELGGIGNSFQQMQSQIKQL